MSELGPLLDRFERAAMAYERLGKLSRDDDKTRAMRKDAMSEMADARRALLAAFRDTPTRAGGQP